MKLIPVIALAVALGLMASAGMASDNPANDGILKAPAADQLNILSQLVGKNCTAATIFDMGVDKQSPHKSEDWTVKCTDGRSFIVAVPPDGNCTILDCEHYKTMTGLSCFKKLKQ